MKKLLVLLVLPGLLLGAFVWSTTLSASASIPADTTSGASACASAWEGKDLLQSGNKAKEYEKSGCDDSAGGNCTSKNFTKSGVKRIAITCSALSPGTGPTKSGSACQKQSFLGLIPWYQYLTLNDDCSISEFTVLGSDSDVPKVLLAVVDDLLRIAGLVAVIFVIYGGIQYATSQGNPDQASKAQSSIINALAGLAVSLVAVAFVSFLGGAIS